MGTSPQADQPEEQSITIRRALPVWISVALQSFGGPAGQIAVMHKLLVEEKRWISESRFLHALNYCMLLPGPEAQQLATYIGWLMHRTRGGLMAGGLFVLPGFLAILGLSVLYALFSDVKLVEAMFFGIKPAVLAIVVGAVIRIGKRVLKNEVMFLIAFAAFTAIFLFRVPFPLIVLGAGLTGYLGGRFLEQKFLVIREHEVREEPCGSGNADRFLSPARPDLYTTLRTAGLWLAIWLAPVIALTFALDDRSIFVQEAWFFSQAAIVTFGGAYAVLAFIAQRAVETYGWLQPGEMLDGLGMAETTPGPLIMVVQFVGFMGAFRQPGLLEPVWAGVLASVLVTWVTFAPSFLFIFTGAPYIEHLRGNKSLSSALSAITAAVVGVILNLGVWFSLNTLFGRLETVRFGGAQVSVPTLSSLQPASAVIAAAAFVVYFGLKWNMAKTLALCTGLGLAYYFILP